MHTEEGPVYLFVAIDRTSKRAFAGWQPRATKALAADFLRRIRSAIPNEGYQGLSDNGTQFGNMPHQVCAWRHIFDRVCAEHGIDHRFTRPAHPWTHGRVERFNRTLEEAAVKRYHSQDHRTAQRAPASLFAGLEPRQTPQAPAGENTPRIPLPIMASQPNYLYS